jgi:phage replication-related protein YjqB (UPF0714/DUF867 family)
MTSESVFSVTPYRNFSELAQHEEEGFDYLIRHRSGSSGVLVMAPHAGGIEPGTGDIADALAGSEHAFYCFKGLKKSGNHILHITSNHFDEPRAVRLLGEARWVLTVHGCREAAPLVWVGGRALRQGDTLIKALKGIGISAGRSVDPALRGLQSENICNRGCSGAGVQLEISRGLREMLFSHLFRRRLRHPTPLFDRFTTAVRNGLKDAAGY